MAVPSAEVLIVLVFVCCRPGSTIVDLAVDFTTSVNESFVRSVAPAILQNLMDAGNTFTINGVNYDAGINMLFEREVPRMNGSRIIADNITACTSAVWLVLFSHIDCPNLRISDINVLCFFFDRHLWKCRDSLIFVIHTEP